MIILYRTLLESGIVSTQRVEGKINKNNVSLTVTNLPQNNKNNKYLLHSTI